MPASPRPILGRPEQARSRSPISISSQCREFVSVLGPSGCGKSTLLRIIGGLLAYDGAVEVSERAVKGPSPDISIVFQKSNLLPWLTTEANLQLGAQIRRKPITPSITAAMVDVLGLKGFEASYPHQLSGGMQQRVSLGQALVQSQASCCSTSRSARSTR